MPLVDYLKLGFVENKAVWHLLLSNLPVEAFTYSTRAGFLYLLGSTLLMASILGLIGLISNNPHEAKMKALQKGSLQDEAVELIDKVIVKALKKLVDEHPEGTVLGVSKSDGKPIIIPDHFINQVALVLGTTGSGKTITLRRFYQRANILSL